jgi:S-adenosylmethionine hydrolase
MLSDFGHNDAYVGIMKSVILGICPDAQIFDLCHDVPAQNVLSGAHILATAVPFLPDDTIVVAVVDPGVGTNRRAVAVQTARNTFIVPDNGLLTEVFDLHPPERAVELDVSEYHLDRISQTFHGRDIFSPCGAHLAAGVDFDDVGTEIDVEGLIRLPEIGPLISEDAIEARVVHIDHFGNAITNLRRETVEALERDVDCVKIKGNRAPLATTFSDVAESAAVCYFNSTDYLELSVRNGSAAEQFELEQRDMLHVITRG